MNIKKELPPHYEEICKILSPGDTSIFCYGDTIYAPHITDEKQIEDHLHVHESVHQKQQGNDPDGWWVKYLADEDFRLSQELEAYAAQYAFVFKKNVPLKLKERFLQRIASDLSGPTYGNLLAYSEAESKIKRLAKAK